jgi:phosphatidylglycerol lysyltransferase
MIAREPAQTPHPETPAVPVEPESERKRLLSRLLPFGSVLFFVGALFLLQRELKDFRYKDVFLFLQGLPSERIVQALCLTAFGYLTLTGYDVLAFRYIGKPITYWKIALASFIGYAFSNALGLPLLTGTPVRLRFYTGWGLSALEVARVLLFGIVTFWLGFLALGGVTFLIAPVPVPESLHLGVITARPIGVLFLLVVAAYLLATVLWRKPVSWRGVEVALPHPRLAVLQVADAMLDWAFAAAVLYSLLPESWNITFPQLLGAFLFAQIAGLISQVPAGLGVFETMIMLLLPKELPRGQVLAMLVAFRAVYYFLPLLVAAVLLGGYEAAKRRTNLGKIARVFGERAPDVVPQVLALTTFVGGAILLASGATPAVHTRLSWLSNLIPLQLIEISHFLGSLVGAALLFLAIGLQRRLDAAYQLTLLMLASGVVFSLLKGLDWEEALTLTLMFAALAPCHAHFYRKASLTGESFTPAWIAAIAIVLGGCFWLGFFAYKHVDYRGDLWWHFTLFGNAPRFLRASVGVVAVALVIALGRLLRPALPEPSWPTPEDLDKSAEIAGAFPRTYSYLALLGDKELLFNDERNAFLMFGVEKRSWVGMGDPVGPEEEHADLVWRFREMCDRHGGWTVFYQVSGRSLHLYVDLGLSLIKLGEEARVPLPRFSLEGSRRKKLRHAHRRAVEEGARFEIIPASEVEAILPELEEISNEWLRAKSTREKGFSLGRFDPDYLKRLPMALVRQGDRVDGDDRIVAFANLWPGGDKEELSIDLMRHRESAPFGIMDYLFLELLLWGKAEGYSWFNLGMAPLAGLEARALAPLWSRLGALVFRHGEHFYNFQGLRHYKDKFDPVWEPRYLACPGGLGGLVLPRVLADVAALISGGFRGVVAK